jgi:hypothetical protein
MEALRSQNTRLGCRRQVKATAASTAPSAVASRACASARPTSATRAASLAPEGLRAVVEGHRRGDFEALP